MRASIEDGGSALRNSVNRQSFAGASPNGGFMESSPNSAMRRRIDRPVPTVVAEESDGFCLRLTEVQTKDSIISPNKRRWPT